MSVIEIRGLSKRFGTTLAVDDLSFEVEQGDVTGFLGPNGAGKTTTLRALLGLVEPDRGWLRLNGRRYQDLASPGRQVGAVLESASFHPARTARNHLRVLAAVEGLPDRRVDEVLALVGLAEVARGKVGGFSFGMRQRLGLAAALLGDPRVLVLDEPANGLDPEGIRWLREFLRSFAGRGGTVLISSHVLAEIAQTADRVVIIGQGRKLADAPLAELTTRPAGPVRVRSPQAGRLAAALAGDGIVVERGDEDGLLLVSGGSAAAVGELAAREGVVVHELVAERSTLEQVFFELTTQATAHATSPPAPGGPAPGPPAAGRGDAGEGPDAEGGAA
ncbi:MAG TPA: ABC transporter ATP-binding protein [Actinomycetes bacterium]|nr:ABC transporter ATP-binding protein [Actinomycetes bacterium]